MRLGRGVKSITLLLPYILRFVQPKSNEHLSGTSMFVVYQRCWYGCSWDFGPMRCWNLFPGSRRDLTGKRMVLTYWSRLNDPAFDQQTFGVDRWSEVCLCARSGFRSDVSQEVMFTAAACQHRERSSRVCNVCDPLLDSCDRRQITVPCIRFSDTRFDKSYSVVLCR